MKGSLPTVPEGSSSSRAQRIVGKTQPFSRRGRPRKDCEAKHGREEVTIAE
ncbi:MAG: hypothetical protein AMXMBFR13_47920, partial [Phycisphaerae bacterium]